MFDRCMVLRFDLCHPLRTIQLIDLFERFEKKNRWKLRGFTFAAEPVASSPVGHATEVEDVDG